MTVTCGHLLGGKVRYVQPREGFRSGIEPVLLAAAVNARAGDSVLEAGTGAGAALLCLSARVPGVLGIGVDRDAGMLPIARANAAANRNAGLQFVAADVGALPLRGPFDHACANPPYHPAGGTTSPQERRETAKRAAPGLFDTWIWALARLLRPRGTLTFILPAAALPACLSAMGTADCAATAVLPLWPGEGRAAKLVIVQGVRGGRSPLRLLSGLVLHHTGGTFTPEADEVLRGGAALTLA